MTVLLRKTDVRNIALFALEKSKHKESFFDVLPTMSVFSVLFQNLLSTESREEN